MSARVILARMFHHGNILAHALCLALQTLWQMDVSTQERFNIGNFWHREFLAQGIFGTGTFRHLNISAHGYFGTLQSNMDVSAQTLRHLCYCAEMSMFQNIPVPKCSCAKNSSCRKDPMRKSPHVKCSFAKMFICRNVCSAKW